MVEEYNPESSNKVDDRSVLKGRLSREAYREYLESKGLNPGRWEQDFEYLEKECLEEKEPNLDRWDQDFEYYKEEELTV